MKKPHHPSKTARKLRCAIYTRKSTEEGLEMEFNSLDAQREACEAYIASQKSEGWVELADRYDDGGFSGGTLERPALRRLLADIEDGRVDVVVVYKIDRLSRSLMDFSKLVEVFDRRGVTFVSVTQSFNTTTSMGRLTLNILLSFAQFAREVIGERIRDKFAASRARGMWMGGHPPLGYDVKDRKLVVNEVEAATVRMIFERFLRVGSAKLTLASTPPLDPRFGSEFVRVNVGAALQQEQSEGRWKRRLDALYLPGRTETPVVEAELIEHGLKWSPVKVYAKTMPQGVGESSNWRLSVNYLTRAVSCGVAGVGRGGIPANLAVGAFAKRESTPRWTILRLRCCLIRPTLVPQRETTCAPSRLQTQKTISAS